MSLYPVSNLKSSLLEELNFPFIQKIQRWSQQGGVEGGEVIAVPKPLDKKVQNSYHFLSNFVK